MAPAPLESTAGLFQPLAAGHSSKRSLFVAEPPDLWHGALGRELLSPPNPFPVPMRPGCKLFTLMLVRRSLGKPCAAGMLGAKGGTGRSCVPCPGRGEALSTFHTTQGEKSGVCAAKQLFLLPSAGIPHCIPVQLCTPLPASQGREPRALPGSGSPQRPPEGQGLAWGEPANLPHPEHHQCAVVALASRPLILTPLAVRPVSLPCLSPSCRLPAPRGG